MVQTLNIVGRRRLVGGLTAYLIGLILAPIALDSQFAAGEAALLWAVAGGIPLAFYICWPLARRAIATPESAAESIATKPGELTELAERLTKAADLIARSTAINVLSSRRPLAGEGREVPFGPGQLEGLVSILSSEDRRELRRMLIEERGERPRRSETTQG
ncbi:MAG: hypothetical protein HYX29_11790 [Solirubrobacterales bacterium]|nr:hypothetical protein [Solirubrobacterales bacterium]